jgi:protein-tyrosine-phosphatase
MAEGLLRKLLAQAEAGASVGSAGLLPGGAPATPEAIGTMAERGVDLRRHRSRTLTAGTAAGARLVVGMARHHARAACIERGAPAARTFTLRELVRRGEAVGARRGGEPLERWLARVRAGRRPAGAVGRADDIADPVGRPRAAYEALADELEDLLRRLVALVATSPLPAGTGAAGR